MPRMPQDSLSALAFSVFIALIFCLAAGPHSANASQSPTPNERNSSLPPNAQPVARSDGQSTVPPLVPKSPELLFQEGISAFKKGNRNAARIAFQESLKLNPANTAALFNLALIEHKSGRPGLAIGLWRKALVVDPSYDEALQAITWARSRLERPDLPREMELWETFRQQFLVGVPFESYLFFTTMLLLIGGWLLLRHFGLRRHALLDEKPLPPQPVVALTLIVGFVIFLALTISKILDAAELRGTVVVKKVEARSTPGDNGTPLFELYEGLEVIIRQKQGTWTQVSYPGSSTGWVPVSSIFTPRDEVGK